MNFLSNLKLREPTKSPVVCSSAGHAGMNPDGTYDTAPDKMYDWGDTHTFHNKGVFYEGVPNRIIERHFKGILETFGIKVISLSDEYQDISLQTKVSIVNTWFEFGEWEMSGVDFHSNAHHNPEARGMEVFCYPGSKVGVQLAENYYKYCQALFGNQLIYRRGSANVFAKQTDKYMIIRNTRIPFILIENLFFTNLRDAIYLTKAEWLHRFAHAAAMAFVKHYIGLGYKL